MKLRFCKVFLACSFILFWHVPAHPALIPGTLVKTPNGFVSIENLKIGDKVTTCNPDESIIDKPLNEAIITNIVTSTTSKVFVIETNNGVLDADKDQLFYDPALGQCLKTENLTTDNKLVSLVNNYSEYCDCLKIETLNVNAITYDISIESPHVYFVSNAQILTHNFFPIVAVGFSFAFGKTLGSISLVGIGMALGALGVTILSKKEPKPIEILHEPEVIQFEIQQEQSEQGGATPKKEDNKKTKPDEASPNKDKPKKERPYTLHGEKRAEERNYTKEEVERIIESSKPIPGKNGTTIHYDPKTDTGVITKDDGAVVTVGRGIGRTQHKKNDFKNENQNGS